MAIFTLFLKSEEIDIVPGEPVSIEFSLDITKEEKLLIEVDNFTIFYPEFLVADSERVFLAEDFGIFKLNEEIEFDGIATLQGLALFGNSDSTELKINKISESDTSLVKSFLLLNKNNQQNRFYNRFSYISKVYPIPIFGAGSINLNYVHDYPSNLIVLLADQAGKIVFQKNLGEFDSGVSLLEIDLPSWLSTGNYYILVEDEFGRKGTEIILIN